MGNCKLDLVGESTEMAQASGLALQAVSPDYIFRIRPCRYNKIRRDVQIWKDKDVISMNMPLRLLTFCQVNK